MEEHNVPSPRRFQTNARLPDLYNCTAHERAECDTSYTGESEQRHGQAARPVAPPNVTNAATDDIDSNRGCATAEETSHYDGGKVVGERGAEEEEFEYDVPNLAVSVPVEATCKVTTYEITRHAARVLSQGNEEQWENSSAHVPAGRCPVEVRERIVLDVP